MYIALLVLTVVSSLFIKNKNRYTLFIGMVLTVVSCVRSESVGGDLTNYRMVFDLTEGCSIGTIFLKIRYEPLFSMLYFVVHLIGGSFRTFIVVCSILSLIGPICFIQRHSKQPWMSFFLYISGVYYLSTLSMLRACIAMSISLFAIDAFMDGRIL